jgi:hypothetical protein
LEYHGHPPTVSLLIPYWTSLCVLRRTDIDTKVTIPKPQDNKFLWILF